MLTRGVLLGDRYRLGERVATGGMGAVWRGTDVLLEREVAVKVLLPSLVADPEFTARFRAEAQMLAALRHPGVVAVHDVGQATLADGSRVDYLVMEYVEGEPLSARVRVAGRLDPATTMSVLAQAADALHTAHLAGIVHRDVKPGNLLVKADGRVVLVDFGIARSRSMAGLTAANMVLGTASYMSPEQATGQPVSPATDVYALGAVAYFCLAGQPPFDGDNPLAVALRHAQDEPAPLPSDTPPAVVAVVARALAKRPADRFASAAELAGAAADARDATLARIPPADRPPWAVAAPTPPVPSPAPAAPAVARPVPSPAPPAPAVARPIPTPAPPAAPAPPPSALRSPAGFEAGPATGPTREDPLRRAPSGRRRGVLIGAAAVVLVALVAVAVAALQPDARPGGSDQPPALAGGSASAPDVPLPTGDAATPGPRPSGTPGASRTGAAGPTEAGGPTEAAGQPGAPTSGAPVPRTTAPGSTPTAAATGKPTSSGSPAGRPNPYTATQVCGSGYQVVDSATLTGGDGRRRGRVYLLYHSGTGNNCVVTLKDTAVGTKSAASAYLEVQGRARSTDSGSFDYYAGPVRAGAAATCVKWGGATGGVSYGSGFEHCD
ncbi:serine/threonine-protein kinase [Micromonospora cremea]|uniref:non-specific serine/threonine protein kinase n=1 Tax=Micromonospora cremea TaxID=709881 RepID=A0A1N5YNU4_9ACTN|nr:serine/threonine-protein kinase [Micromonospora cremea]SIN11313.1 serine/threonine protein kinase [Micromonospora cremea]